MGRALRGRTSRPEAPQRSRPDSRLTVPFAVEGHGGDLTVAVARAHGVETIFTLSGAHVFPIYDGAERADPPMRLLDVRHEATAVFAAEATGKLARKAGLAVLTAGPGVTNGVSAIAQASFAGSPLVVVGGRSPSTRWGTGSLQELDHPALLGPITRRAATIGSVDEIPERVDDAFTTATSSHRGPVFLDVAMDHLYARSSQEPLVPGPHTIRQPDTDDIHTIAELLSSARQPVLVLGTDVWADGAEDAALRFVMATGMPVVTNGMGRGIIERGTPHLVTKARSTAFRQCDLALVAGTPLDFRLGYGVFGDPGRPSPVVHVADSPDRARRRAAERRGRPHPPGTDLRRAAPRLADDSVVIGDGGDFVSFAGKYVEPARPGGWLDPGPFGCLGAGLGAAIGARLARPSAQVVLLLGDGAAGMSLMDVDTLVRHQLPVVIVVGNNAGWGLERHPMRMLYGYDVAADLTPGTSYDGVARALGGAGETVSDPAGIGAALDRAFDAGCPYLVNVLTDPEVAYPRSTYGV